MQQVFGGKKRQAAINTLVGADSRVHGDVEFSGGFLVDGQVIGNVKSAGDDDAMLSVSERGSVEGTVVAPHILLNGTIRGDVIATERVELGPKSRVIGNVQYKLIEMAIGAEVNGKLIHESDKKAAANSRPGGMEPATGDRASTVVGETGNG
jgi:cytoskeletal protein CcmA (bactofilin family)